MATRADTIAHHARGLGFVGAGCTPLGPLPDAPFVAAWLADGRAGEMGYLERRAAERADPRGAFPWARALISVAYPYPPPPPAPADWRTSLRGRIAAYAAGPDYHTHILTRLEALADRLGATFPGARFLAYVDTGPIVERAWASRAGLGALGRNTLLLDRAAGSYVLLGELLTDLEVEPAPPVADHCGPCMRCVRACPTGALEAGYTMDPRRCIADLTIELRGPIPVPLRPALENWIFGCDLCQQVCPWNAAGTETDELTPVLPDLLALDADGFRTRFGRTAVARTRRAGLLRNVAVALGNSGNPDAVPSLARALGDPDALVRGHAAWALGRIGGHAARRALDVARARENDAETAAEITAALA